MNIARFGLNFIRVVLQRLTPTRPLVHAFLGSCAVAASPYRRASTSASPGECPAYWP